MRVRYALRLAPALILGLALPVSAQSPATDASETTDATAREQVTVTSLHLEERDGRDRVVLELSRPAAFRVINRGGENVLEIRDAAIGDGVETALSAAAGSAGAVRSAAVTAEGSRVVVRVRRGEGASGTAIRAGRRIIWMFQPGQRHAARPATRTIAREEDFRDEADQPITVVGGDEAEGDAAEEETDSAEAAAFLSDVPMQVGASRRRRYSGRRVDLDLLDADILNVLRLLSEVGGVNIVAADDVGGTVTIRLLNVPWDQALEVVLQAKGLGMVRRGNLIRVAPLARLQAEREAAIAQRAAQIQLAPIEVRLIPVSYGSPTLIADRVRELLSDRGTVSVDLRTSMLVVRDIAENIDNAEELVRALDTQTPQVLIEARIVEATSAYTREVGIQWGGDVTMSSANGNPTGLVFPSNVGIAGGATDAQAPTQGLSPFANVFATPNYAVNLPASVGTGAGGALGLTLGSVGGNVNLNVRLSAAEARGTVRIISSPRILTLQNMEATIAQGTLIPYSVVSAQGVNTAFQEAKLQLAVVPRVTNDGSVLMRVNITRDEPDFSRTSARGDPTILKRQAQTTLLVPDGHTAVIGGIYTRTTSRGVEQVPFFGDIPVLGVLFQRRSVRDDRNELLIFVTPRIVNRAEALPN